MRHNIAYMYTQAFKYHFKTHWMYQTGKKCVEIRRVIFNSAGKILYDGSYVTEK